MLKYFFIIFLILIYTSCKENSEQYEILTRYHDQLNIVPNLKLKKGFSASLLAQIKGARSVVYYDNALYVSTGGKQIFPQKSVYKIDLNSNFKAVKIRKIIQEVVAPNGIDIIPPYLYIASPERLHRYHLEKMTLENTTLSFPVFSNFHSWKYLRAHAGKLYTAIGYPYLFCEPDTKFKNFIASPSRHSENKTIQEKVYCHKNPTSLSDKFSSILEIDPTSFKFKIIAKGIRNSLGIDFHPIDKKMWFSDNARDGLGKDEPYDEINILNKTNSDFGFPYCINDNENDPGFKQKISCQEKKKPFKKLAAHSAPLGIHFYKGKMFPKEYRNKLFIAEHGSSDLSLKRGYKVSVLDTKNKILSTFIDGFTNSEFPGRPVDFTELPDGSLIISDDNLGNLYRITYQNIQ